MKRIKDIIDSFNADCLPFVIGGIAGGFIGTAMFQLIMLLHK